MKINGNLLLSAMLAVASYAQAQTAGDFRSIASGNWNSTAVWERYNGSIWVGTVFPTNTSCNVVTVRSPHIVTNTAALTIDQVVIESGATLRITNGLMVANGTGIDMDIFGTVDNVALAASGITNNTSASIVIETNGVLKLSRSSFAGSGVYTNNSGIYQHAINGGTVPTMTWNSNATCEITGIGATVPGGLGQSFYNFTWNCVTQSTALNLAEALTTVQGNFTMAASSNSTLAVQNGGNYTLAISGDYIQTGGTLVDHTTGNGSLALISVGGNFSLSGGILDLNTDNKTQGTLQVAGDFSVTGTGLLRRSNSGGASVVFNGSGIQNYTNSGTITNTIDFVINAGSIVLMGTNLLPNGCSGDFTLNANGGLGIGDPNGLATSGATGNVRVTGTRTFNTGTYIYNGTVAQITGNGLPTTVSNLTIANPAGVTLTTNVSLTGICTIQTTGFLLGSTNVNGPVVVDGTFSPGAGVVGKFTTRRQTWDSAGVYSLDITNANSTPGVGWDLLTLTNAQGINIAATSGNPFVIKLVSSLGNGTAGLTANFTNSLTNTWIIATTTNASFTNFAANKFTVDTTAFSNDINGGAFSVLTNATTGATNLVLKFTPDNPTAVAFVAQPATTTAGATLSAVTVQLKKAGNVNKAQSGVTISLALVGGGSLGGTTNKTTDANGLATFDDLVITSAGSGKTLTANSSGLTSDTSSSFTINVAAASKLTIQTQPSVTVTAGVAFAQQPIVRIEDQYGNLRSADNTTSVAAARIAGSGSLQGTTTATASGGVATFANLAHNVATNITIEFSASGLTSVTSAVVTINPAAAHHLTIQTQPSSTVTAGVAFAQQPVVRIEDQFNNLRSADTTTVNAARTTGVGSGTLQGNTAIAAVAGIVTFTNFSHNVATNITIDFTASGVTGATSGSITVNPAAAHHLTIQTQPSSTATAGVAFAQQPIVRIEDQFNNLRSSDTTTVSAARTSGVGSGTLQGNASIAAVAGIVTFTNLSHNIATNITIDFTASGVTSATSSSIAVSAAAASKLVFITQPGGAVHNTVFTTQPVVRSRDVYDNNSTVGLSGSLNLTVTLTSGSGNLQGTQTIDIGTSAGNGLATFTNLKIVGAGDKQITASASGLTDAVSSTFTVTKKNQNISFGSLGNKTYGNAAFALSASSDSSLAVTFSVQSGSASLSDGTNVNLTGTGSVTIRASQAGDSDFNPAANVDQSFNVSSATLTVTADSTNRAYGVANPAFTYGITGFVNGENSSVVSGTPSLTTVATAVSNVGNYTIVAAINTLSAANYSFSFVNGTLTINQAVLSGGVTSSLNPARPTSNVTFTATLTGAGAGTPTGTVQFKSDGSALGSPAALSSSIATVDTASLTHGYHTITAEYAGDSNCVGTTNTLSPNQLINTSPLATNDTLATYQNYSTTAAKFKLLINDADPDGDSILVTNVSVTSAQGGSVTVASTTFTYHPPTDYIGTDTVAYVITDSFGATNSGTIVITVRANTNQPDRVVSISNLIDGNKGITFAGIPGYTYVVQATTNLVPVNWAPISTNVAGGNGLFIYNDLSATNYSGRYYRSVAP